MDEQVARIYRRFAEVYAPGRSAIYGQWATGVAEDDHVSELIGRLPGIKRQPNLVFAAARHVGASLSSYALLRPWLIQNWDAVAATVMARRTQTNEAARCAVLLPILSRLRGPLALIEVGAAAGLCLYPDRYSYRYQVGNETIRLDPDCGPSPLMISCEIDQRSVPDRLPEVAWRAGIDLNPLDVRSPSDRAWLETLIWPEQSERRERLMAACRLAASDPPYIVPGDILDELPALIKQTPPNTHVVVFHTAVAVYLEQERREAFAELMLGMPEVTWISAEDPKVFPFISEQVNADFDPSLFVTAVNATPVAITDPHGASYQSL